MSVVTADRLPAEAADTLALIADDGPFPHDKDGTVFHNYEGRLPERSDGYYREYTVDTPGVRGRGARRIVTGDGGEVFYTDDHYETFQAVARR
jgi:ribonuclease T1